MDMIWLERADLFRNPSAGLPVEGFLAFVPDASGNKQWEWPI